MDKKAVRVSKFVLYLAGKILAAVIAVLLILFALHTAMNSSEIYMKCKDAFSLRSSVLLEPVDNKDVDTLPKIFTQKYLDETGLATQRLNVDYDITSYDQRTDVTIAVVFPWQKEAKVTVKNVVQDIKAKVLSAEGSFTPVDSFIESGIYTVTLIKTDEGNWMVGDIELEEEVTPEIVNPIPTPAPAETDTSEDEGGDEEEGAVPEDTESPTPEE